MSPFLLFFCVLSSIKHIAAQPAYVYDGVSTVSISGLGKTNWTLKYPVGVLCEDITWTTTLKIDINTTTPNQADLVLAFGTTTIYFAAVIAFDGGIWIENLEPRKGAIFVAPEPGQNLYDATSGSLELQYAESDDFRTALIPSGDKDEWYKVAERKTPFAGNTDQLILTIDSDRRNDVTQLTIEKNEETTTIQMGSTWPIISGEQVNIFMGLDAIHNEVFVVSGIEVLNSQCTSITLPTPPTTAEPTPAPTLVPTMTPTDNTDAPSSSTLMPSVSPTDVPTKVPSDITNSPSSASPSLLPSVIPSMAPTEVPSRNPSASMENTAMPSSSPSVSPSENPTVSTIKPSETNAVPTVKVILEDEDNTEDKNKDDTVSESGSTGPMESIAETVGLDPTIFLILIIVWAVILLVLIGACVYCCNRKRKRKKSNFDTINMATWEE